VYFLAQECSIDNNVSLDNTYQNPLLLNMENQPKSVQNTLLLCHCHLLFQFLLHNVLRMLYTPMMLFSFSDCSFASFAIFDIDIPIVVQKGKHICTFLLLSNFVSYSLLLSSYSAFIYSVDLYSVLESVKEALLS